MTYFPSFLFPSGRVWLFRGIKERMFSMLVSHFVNSPPMLLEGLLM